MRIPYDSLTIEFIGLLPPKINHKIKKFFLPPFLIAILLSFRYNGVEFFKEAWLL